MADQSDIEKAKTALKTLLLGPPASAFSVWPNGPASEFRKKTVPVDEYIDLIRAVEAGPAGAEGIGPMVQRLRRLYFSYFTMDKKGAVGALFDKMMNRVTVYEQPPLTTAHVTQAQLDRLYETGAIDTGAIQDSAISHVWGLADIALNGLNALAFAGQATLFATPLRALVSWLGDLASVIVRYELQLPGHDAAQGFAGRKQLLAHWVGQKMTKGDLIGNVDGVAIASQWARTAPASVSSFLQDYYDHGWLDRDQASRHGRPSAAHRFHYFLRGADPPLPATGLDSSPFIATFDKTAARNAMPDWIGAATDDLTDVNRIEAVFSGEALQFLFSEGVADRRFRKSTEERLDEYGARDGFHWLCDEFCRAIDEGTRTGDCVWPPVP